MSGRLVGEVLDHAPIDLTPLELLVLVALAETARDTDRIARYGTSCDALADRTRMKPSSVKTALFRLRHRGLIIGLHEKPRKGLAQQYTIPKMTEHTRRQTWA